MLDEYTLSLTDLCMEVNCETIGNLLRSSLEDELGDSTRNFYFTFRNRVFLPEKLCEKFITMLSAKGLLNPYTMSLFDYESTHLRYAPLLISRISSPSPRKSLCVCNENFIRFQIFKNTGCVGTDTSEFTHSETA